MIECTKAIDGLVSAAFGKNMVTISRRLQKRKENEGVVVHGIDR